MRLAYTPSVSLINVTMPLYVLPQLKRDEAAAVKFLRRLTGRQGMAPPVIVSDKLHESAKVTRQITPKAQHIQGIRLNNRAENSRQPKRRRERML